MANQLGGIGISRARKARPPVVSLHGGRTMKRTAVLLGIAAAVLAGALALAAESKGDDQAQIKALEDDLMTAIKAKDIDKIMTFYVNSPDLVVFDVIPPRQYTGSDAYKKDWTGFLGQCKDAPVAEISDLSVEVGGRLAFGHSIQHIACTDTKGGKMDMTVRVTDGYRKVKGKWLIAHEHVSVPVDLATAKGDLQSKP
jgi:ketosteroid isomerase-like protein